MKSSNLLKNVADYMEDTIALDSKKGLCYYCARIADNLGCSAIPVLNKIASLIGEGIFLQDWLLKSGRISINEWSAMRNSWDWDEGMPTIAISRNEREAAQLKLKRMRVTWAKQLAEEFEKEGD